MSTKNDEASKRLRIGFIHPDLGIGGAERLVVDAAVSLQKRGHDVTIFTSRHDPNRCFEETRNGTLLVHTLSTSLLPMALPPPFPPMTIFLSIFRSLYLTALLLFSLYLPGPPGPLSPLARFDAYIVDQQSVCVPLLRVLGGTRVVFYCHFPDKLLSGGWEFAGDGGELRRKGVGLVRRLYRWPVDKLEESTTGQADVVLSNSHFTSKIYARAFPSLAKRPPKVVYPCIDVDAYAPLSKKGKAKVKEAKDEHVGLIASDRPTLLSLNRFEAKKNVALAVRSFAKLRDDSLVPHSQFASLRLIIGGGFDPSLPENSSVHQSLQSLCDTLSLPHHTLSTPTSSPPPESAQVIFIHNFTSAQRLHLLTAASTIALLYTPANEHFGIVPIEAMGCGLPVLAANSGGPVESIIDFSVSPEEGTGLLRKPVPEEWAPAIARLLSLSEGDRERISRVARSRVERLFSSNKLGEELERAVREAVGMGDVHEQLGDWLIWWGAGLMVFAAANIGLIYLLYGFKV